MKNILFKKKKIYLSINKGIEGTNNLIMIRYAPNPSTNIIPIFENI